MYYNDCMITRNLKKLTTIIIFIFIYNSNSLAFIKDLLIDTYSSPEYFSAQTTNLNPDVVKLALTAYQNAIKNGVKNKQQIITIIDYSLPSNIKRLWVLDLKTQKVIFNTWVAHGKNSGENFADHFSNSPKSLQSSIGLYETGGTYFGNNGYSLVLHGLDKGFNDKAESRRIVMHPAPYVDESIIREHGRIGRSWGCPALNPEVATPLINTIKGGTLLLAYYPNAEWLQKSNYLQG
jgi:hypothetical protein